MRSKEVRRKAALLEYVMWAGVEKHKLRRRRLYPLFSELGYFKMRNKTPWCEYLLIREGVPDGEECVNCPLFIHNNDPRNAGENDLFDSWAISTYTEDKALYAGEIARVAWAEYKRLGG